MHYWFAGSNWQVAIARTCKLLDSCKSGQSVLGQGLSIWVEFVKLWMCHPPTGLFKTLTAVCIKVV